ncbi:MAG TPA: RimK family alpha-L-glutamate ligase [Alphaproteobacteria bacterium]|jgi:ribosomal protein S6--L-glutamate ligase|nr:RimK family alpha-L-glutamate ligase [Micavibrio sp.]MBK9562771.1 RimK family alpha-L-glutamate ligase [Micavibrio sp.]HQX26591.1 RimK family alpha-L-glutamate ligase [Alphaproteobacteria bacterium]
MKIGILTTGSKHEDERLVEAATSLGHEADLLKVLKCSLRVSNKEPKIFYEGQDISGNYDIIIPRINLPHTVYGLTILRHFQVMGVYTSDVALALEIGRDKLRCKQYLTSQGIPVPTTGYAHSKNDFDTIIQTVGGAPLILKLVEGTEGTGVFLAKDEKEAVNILGSFKQFDARIIAQEFIEESSGSDIRAFVVGNKVVASMLRQSQDGDFRANVALGAHSFKVALTDAEEKMVLAAVKAIGINIAGVDVIRSRRGPLIIEINVAPDFGGEFGLETTTGVNVAKEIIKFAVRGKERSMHKPRGIMSLKRWRSEGLHSMLPQRWQ